MAPCPPDARSLAERLHLAVRPAGHRPEGAEVEVAAWSAALLGLAQHAVARSDMAVAFRCLSARLRDVELDGEARWLPWLERVDSYSYAHFADPAIFRCAEA
mgnify:CR=1 FL=1